MGVSDFILSTEVIGYDLDGLGGGITNEGEGTLKGTWKLKFWSGTCFEDETQEVDGMFGNELGGGRFNGELIMLVLFNNKVWLHLLAELEQEMLGSNEFWVYTGILEVRGLPGEHVGCGKIIEFKFVSNLWEKEELVNGGELNGVLGGSCYWYTFWEYVLVMLPDWLFKILAEVPEYIWCSFDTWGAVFTGL